MKISIAMATYNGADYLPEQLQSFIDQTRQPDELVVCDDCSTDATINIIREFAKKASFEVRYYQNETNLGYTGNFNRAMTLTTGDLVFLSDQDDVWFPDKIATHCILAEEDHASLVFINDASFADSDLNEAGFTVLSQHHSVGYGDAQFLIGCCCSVRRELLDFCLPIPNGFDGHDKWIHCFANGLERKRILRKVLQYYRRTGSNTSTSITNRMERVRRQVVLFEKIRSIFVGDLAGKFIQSLKQQRLFLSGIERAIPKTSGELRNELGELQQVIIHQIQVAETRLAIQRERFILTRVGLVLRFWMKGGYRSMGTVKNMLRDVLA